MAAVRLDMEASRVLRVSQLASGPADMALASADDEQRSSLERMTEHGERLLDLERLRPVNGFDEYPKELREEVSSTLDRWTLLFCIALLDHILSTVGY